MLNLEFDINALPTPYYIVDTVRLINNLELLKSVREQTGCKILLAQKAFSMFSLYPLIAQYLDGATASGLYEAKLGYEEMKKENHIFSPAYLESEFEEICTICDHLIFNSFTQWERYRTRALQAGKSCGIRINPECSTQDHAIYDPCSPGSRLGVTLENFQPELLDGIEGLHFHTLCEQNADALSQTLQAVEEKFGTYLGQMKWLNFGGGHHITRPDYDLKRLTNEIQRIQQTYQVQVYLEPGEAVALNTGFLVSTVQDIIFNKETQIAILDTSAACHMPDVLEMPYRPQIIGAAEPDQKAYTYRLGGPTCLAGDIIGDYSFDHPLQIGSRIVFCDMAHYSMVKNNTFNGMALPSIAIANPNHQVELIKAFEYLDFKNRLS